MDRRAACVTALLSLFMLGCPLGPDDDDTMDSVEVSGHVYAHVTCDPQNCVPSGQGPVSGAVVSTSLSAQTATTDADGYFDLRTDSQLPDCTAFTLTITATGYPTYSVRGYWGTLVRDQVFGLSPAWPNGINQGCM